MLKAENPDSDDAPITTTTTASNNVNTTTASSITNSANGGSNTNTSSSAGAVSTDSRPSYSRADLCEVSGSLLFCFFLIGQTRQRGTISHS